MGRLPGLSDSLVGPGFAGCQVPSEGQYKNPVRIVAFNTAEGWSRDVTTDIADELRRRYVEYDEVPASILKFLEAVNRH